VTAPVCVEASRNFYYRASTPYTYLGRLESRLIDAVDHVGIAVKNLDEAIHVYRDVLGFKLEGVHTLNERMLKIAFFSLGESRIELLQPLSADSTVAKFLETRGEGIQHLAVKVRSVEATLEEYKRKGVMLIDEKPRTGALGNKMAFVHPKSTRGVLLELVERP
jgi:methylmalonyl-CoA/ethylmalonyl-CoA epimerase